ncbi:hypothetical protein EV426DRAFT_713002, partial [Tirmania nivea]
GELGLGDNWHCSSNLREPCSGCLVPSYSHIASLTIPSPCLVIRHRPHNPILFLSFAALLGLFYVLSAGEAEPSKNDSQPPANLVHGTQKLGTFCVLCLGNPDQLSCGTGYVGVGEVVWKKIEAGERAGGVGGGKGGVGEKGGRVAVSKGELGVGVNRRRCHNLYFYTYR